MALVSKANQQAMARDLSSEEGLASMNSLEAPGGGQEPAVVGEFTVHLKTHASPTLEILEKSATRNVLFAKHSTTVFNLKAPQAGELQVLEVQQDAQEQVPVVRSLLVMLARSLGRLRRGMGHLAENVKSVLGAEEEEDVGELVAEMPQSWRHDPLKMLAEVDTDLHHQSMTPLEKKVLQNTANMIQHDPWFLPTDNGIIYNYKRRQRCIKRYGSSWFKTLFTSVIVVNAVTLGVSADHDLNVLFASWKPSGVSIPFLLDSIYCLLYIVEFWISAYGCDRYPWRSFELLLDGFLVSVSILDLWIFNLLEILNIAERPNVAFLMVLRLGRFSRVLKAAERFSDIAGPLRLARAMGDIFGNIMLSLLFASFFLVLFASFVVATFDLGEIERFVYVHSKMMSYSVDMVMIFCGHNRWVDMMLGQIEDSEIKHKDNVFTSRMLSKCFAAYVIIILLFNLVLAVMTTNLVEMSMDDTKKQGMKAVRDQINLDWLKRNLKRMVTDESGYVSIRDAQGYMMENPNFEEHLSISMKEMTNLMLQISGNNGFASIDSAALAIYRFKCQPRDMETLLLENSIEGLLHGTEYGTKQAGNLRSACLSVVETRRHKGSADAGIVSTHGGSSSIRPTSCGKASGATSSQAVASPAHEQGHEEERRGIAAETSKIMTKVIHLHTSLDLEFSSLSQAICAMEENLDKLTKILDIFGMAGGDTISDDLASAKGVSLEMSIKLGTFCGDLHDWLLRNERAFEDVAAGTITM